MELLDPYPKSQSFVNRNFALLWSGQAVSLLGDFVFDTTLVLWIAAGIGAHQTWAPLAVSGVLLAAAIPPILVGPFAGVFVDRWDKRRTLLRMDAIRALLILLLALTAGTILMPVWAQLGMIYTIVATASTCAQFFSPARLALLGDVVAEPDRTRAAGLQQVSANLTMILGPSLAAPLFFGVGVRWALLINALSFAGSFIAIVRIRNVASSEQQAGRQGSLRHEFTLGLRFFLGNQVLVTLLISLMLVMLGYGAVSTLNVFFLQQNLHAAVRWYGLLAAATAAGAIAGTALMVVLPARHAPLRTFWVSLLMVGCLHIVYAHVSSLPIALVVLFLVGLPAGALNVALLPVLLHVTPREFVGRVSAVIFPAISVASLVSAALAGYLASTLLRGLHATVFGATLGPIDTIFTATGLLELAAGVYAMFRLRGVTVGEPAVSMSDFRTEVPGESREVAL